MKTLIVMIMVTAFAMGCGDKDEKKAPDKGAESPSGSGDVSAGAAEKALAAADKVGKGEASPQAACAMVSTAEAEAALGKPVKDGAPAVVGCSWDAVEGGISSVSFDLRPAGQWDMAKQVTMQSAKNSGEKVAYEELPGIGDEAFYSGLAGHQVLFKVGERYGTLGMLGPDDDASKQRLIGLAKTVAGKM